MQIEGVRSLGADKERMSLGADRGGKVTWCG